MNESFELTESFQAELQTLDFAEDGQKADEGLILVSTLGFELAGFYSEFWILGALSSFSIFSIIVSSMIVWAEFFVNFYSSPASFA